MEQLLQVRVMVQTIDTERVVTALPYIILLLYPEGVPKNGLTIDAILDTIVIYQKTTGFSPKIDSYVQCVVEAYTQLQRTVEEWQPGKASAQAVLLEESLYKLNSALESGEGEDYVK
ncbi:MAG: hypothetical protein K2M30_02300 [Desulfovibrionaceae bacterium]|nr:hypothetical protein [Desulfovibrionaceae bacterium]